MIKLPGLEDFHYRVAFCNGVVGILLTERGKEDPHIVWHYIGEDDGRYFLKKGKDAVSSAWLPDLISCLKEVLSWVRANSVPDEAGILPNFRVGWRFLPIHLGNNAPLHYFQGVQISLSAWFSDESY